MKAICPGDSSHDRFVTNAHVVEQWVVDASGSYLEVSCTLEVLQGPNIDRIWNCDICGAEAKVER